LLPEKIGDASKPFCRFFYREICESKTPDSRRCCPIALFFIPTMANEAPFKTAMRATLGLGNDIRFSKGRVTVVIDLGGKIFYDKLFFWGEWSMARKNPLLLPFPG
jgi:hypothetical protein